jgi:hypothetical protein
MPDGKLEFRLIMMIALIIIFNKNKNVKITYGYERHF